MVSLPDLLPSNARHHRGKFHQEALRHGSTDRGARVGTPHTHYGGQESRSS